MNWYQNLKVLGLWLWGNHACNYNSSSCKRCKCPAIFCIISISLSYDFMLFGLYTASFVSKIKRGWKYNQKYFWIFGNVLFLDSKSYTPNFNSNIQLMKLYMGLELTKNLTVYFFIQESTLKTNYLHIWNAKYQVMDTAKLYMHCVILCMTSNNNSSTCVNICHPSRVCKCPAAF